MCRGYALIRADQPGGRISREPLGIVDVLVSCPVAVHQLPQQSLLSPTGAGGQVRKRQVGVLPPRVGPAAAGRSMSPLSPKRSSNSLTRIKPASEVARDP